MQDAYVFEKSCKQNTTSDYETICIVFKYKSISSFYFIDSLVWFQLFCGFNLTSVYDNIIIWVCIN